MENQNITQAVKDFVNNARRPVSTRTVINAVSKMIPGVKPHSVKALLTLSAQRGHIRVIRPDVNDKSGKNLYCSMDRPIKKTVEKPSASVVRKDESKSVCKLVGMELKPHAENEGIVNIGIIVKMENGKTLADLLSCIEKAVREI